MNSQQYPNLKYLFSGFFNQDWLYMRLDDLKLRDEQKDVNSSFEYNMQLFTSGSKHRIEDTIAELENLLQLELDETQLRELLFEQLGSYVYAPSLGMTYQVFLKSILSNLQDSKSSSD